MVELQDITCNMSGFKDVTIDSKALMDRYFSFRRNCASELSFTTMFMWRKPYHMKYFITDDMLFISSRLDGGIRHVSMPICPYDTDAGRIKSAIETVVRYFDAAEKDFVFYFSVDDFVPLLDEMFPNRCEIAEVRDSFDYVYSVDELTRLSGKKFHAKKNHVNKFKKLYPNYEYCALTHDNSEECLELFNSWRYNKEVESSGLDSEYTAIKELLGSMDALGVVGGGLRVDGRLIAFSFGEALDSNTALIHLEHADTDYEGAFAMMNQQFLEHEWQDFEFVNREEDMGIPGMRRAKESYRPQFMVKKYVARVMG